MIKEFKEFVMRGSVLELAVAVIIAGAFGVIIKSLTGDIIMPIVGLALGGVNFSDLAYTLKDAVLENGAITAEAVQIRYGAFIQAIIDFVLIAFVIFMLVRSYNKAQELNKKEEEEEEEAAPAGPTQEELLVQIRDLLKK